MEMINKYKWPNWNEKYISFIYKENVFYDDDDDDDKWYIF